ncbi:sugar transferase [[Clostridium] innocuum]|nr:sugar transferase [[Clostridium] innocuum]
MYSKYIKTKIDVLIAIIASIILSPLFIIIAIMIKVTSRGPVFFSQERVGANNRTFKILKFRTMKIDTPSNCPTHLLKSANSYITTVGKFLRKTSLDELPQLWNIIKCDMAIVGPRPSLRNQIDLNKLRDINGASNVKPGLTGLAQISGRDELPIDIKAELDGKYIECITFHNDFKIVACTFIKVLKSDGIKEGGTS